MASQTYQEPPTDNRNELSKCVDYFNKFEPNEGETALDFCKGTGTFFGNTFQTLLDNNSVDNTMLTELKELNIVKVTGQTITITNYDDTCEKDVVIPSSINGTKVVAIGGAAFGGKKLTSVIIPNTVINIMDREYRTNAFGNNNLKKVIIPDSVTTIGDSAFYNNQLTNVSISNNIVTIGKNAFKYNLITNVKLSSSLTSIGQYAFENNQLETFEIPNGLTELTDFLGNNPLKSITFQENSKITVIGTGFVSDNKDMWKKYQNLESIEIPNSVIEFFCDGDKGLTKSPFYELNLKEVIFESNSKLTEIPSYLFYGNQLTEIEIPDSVTTIGGSAFGDNQLTSITIGNGIKYIGNAAFYRSDTSNPNLSRITINKSCSDIKNIPSSSTDTTKYYPWLSGGSTFTANGVTIYGSNNEVCDSY